MAKSYFWAD